MADLPYIFERPDLLELALTHASTGAERNNERLEFLGDAVLDLAVAEELFHLPAQLAEGELTELKAWVVSRRVLAAAAQALGLEQRARVGSGMSGRALPRSVLANLYEALLGAVYIDGGYSRARDFALATLGEQLDLARRRQRGANPKQVLQQRAQIETGRPPDYVLVEERGHAHARAFLIAVEFAGRRFPSAWGRTRKEAEQWAAHEALLLLAEEAAPSGVAPG